MSEGIVVVKDSKKFKTIVTDIGNAKIANAALNGQKVNITTAVVSDGGGFYFTPTPEMTVLENEVWRGEIAAKEINAASKNMVDVKIVLDGTIGGFTIRGIGLLDDEGDLIAVCNTPDTEKAVILDGAPVTLTMIMHVVFTNVDVVEFAVNPNVDSVTTEEVTAKIKTHDDDPAAHGNLIKKVEEMMGGMTKIIASETQPTVEGPLLWLKVIPRYSPEPEMPDSEYVTLDLQDYEEGADLYALIDDEVKTVENATRTTDEAAEPLKIKIN